MSTDKVSMSEIMELRASLNSLRTEYLKRHSEIDEENAGMKVNNKICYNANILAKSLATETAQFSGIGLNLQNALQTLMIEAINKKYPEAGLKTSIINVSYNRKFGDYLCCDAMPLTKILKSKGTVVSPQDVAKELIQNISTCSFIEKIAVGENGFVNINVSKTFLADNVRDIVLNGVKPPGYSKRRVVIDFSSPNIAKEMHVGHLRSTIIGDTLARLMEFVRWDVLRINHVGDWGTHFGMLIAHMEEIAGGLDKPIPPISDLQKFYKEAKSRFDDDEAFKKNAYDKVVQLQSGNSPLVTSAWKQICDLSRKEFEKIYDLLDVRLEEKGESFYHSRMTSIIEELGQKNVITEENGCKIIHTDSRSAPLFVQKSDGGYTYDTSDLATIKYRLKENEADTLIYVVDNGQSDHFSAIFEVARRVGWYSAEDKRVEFVGFGVVLGSDNKKFKTRSGDTIKLLDLLDEGIRRAKEKLQGSERFKNLTPDQLDSISQAVAFGCIRYADLSHNRILDYVFTFDKMLEDKGNTAVYLMYTYTRVKSIIARSNVTENTLTNFCSQQGKPELKEEKDVNLALKLAQFPEVIHRTLEKMIPHQLCDYAYFLCQDLNDFYESFYIISRDRETGEVMSIDMDRLALIHAASKVLGTVFDLLGVKKLEKM